jgi:hypothetical protein
MGKSNLNFNIKHVFDDFSAKYEKLICWLDSGLPNPNLQNQELIRRFLLKIRRKFRRFLLKSGSFLVVFSEEN